MKAIYNDKIVAESNQTIQIEGNHYFPADSIHQSFFKPSDTQTHCPWKGEASYYHLEVDGIENKDSAWYYLEPKSAAKEIKGFVAFWRGVEFIK